jgi:hypothetical protein
MRYNDECDLMQKFLWGILILLGIIGCTQHTTKNHTNQSPIVNYTRTIDDNNTIVYQHKESAFSFKANKLIDTQNYYYGGTKDTYDDPYIREILKNQTVLKRFEGKGIYVIQIVFSRYGKYQKYLESNHLALFRQRGVTVELLVLERDKMVYPLHLSVYPFFVMGARYTQGYINEKLLHQLIEEQHHYSKASVGHVAISRLKETLMTKFPKSMTHFHLTYNRAKELFEVRNHNESQIHSYISKEGRYIMVVEP